MMLVGYVLAFAMPIAGGAVWDFSRAPASAFAPLVLFGLAALVVASRVDLSRRRS